MDDIRSPRMMMDELRRLIERRQPAGHRVLDVRDRDEYSGGHVAGSLRVPAGDVIAHAPALVRHAGLYVRCGGRGRCGRSSGPAS